MNQQLKNIISKNVLHYLVLIILIYFVVFFKLGSFSFRLWDESMFAVNAYEMEKSGNYMVPHSENEIDWNNSKPLLLSWIQVGFIKIFGFSEFTIRLPSAISVAVSVLMLFHFLRSRINLLFAWIASLVLLTSIGYIGLHTGRTGDADALLSLFLLSSTIFYLKYLLEENKKSILIAFIFLSLAVMTKSFAAFLFIPPIILFGLVFQRSKFLTLFKTPRFYVGLSIFLLSLFIVFFLREIYQPGFLNSTLLNDAGRLTNTLFANDVGWDFYILNIFGDRFMIWTIPFLLGVVWCFNVEQSTAKIGAHFCLTVILLYLIPISLSATKLLWYDMPIYPFLAVLAAIPIYIVLANFSGKKISLVFAVVLIFILPYRKMFYLAQSNSFSEGDQKEEAASMFLHNQIKENTVENLTIYHYGYRGSILCYKYMYADLGKELKIKTLPEFLSGEKVFVGNDSLKNCLVSSYSYDTLMVVKNGMLVQIK